MSPKSFESESPKPILLTESSLAHVINEFPTEDAALGKSANDPEPGAGDGFDDVFASERAARQQADLAAPMELTLSKAPLTISVDADDMSRPWRSPDFSMVQAGSGRRAAGRSEGHRSGALAVVGWAAAGVMVAVIISMIVERTGITVSSVPAELTASGSAPASLTGPEAKSGQPATPSIERGPEPAGKTVAPTPAERERSAAASAPVQRPQGQTATQSPSRSAENLGLVLKGSVTPNPSRASLPELRRAPFEPAIPSPRAADVPIARPPAIAAPAAASAERPPVPALPPSSPAPQPGEAPPAAPPAPPAATSVSSAAPSSSAASAPPPASVPAAPPASATAVPPAASASPALPASPSATPPAASAAPPAPTTDVADIERVLGRYRFAFSALDAGAARAVWPGVDTRALGRAFDRLEQQQLEFESCSITVSGGRATAACGGRARYVPKVGSKSLRDEPRQWMFDLSKVDDAWRIDRVASR